jgi:hypothetical protein
VLSRVQGRIAMDERTPQRSTEVRTGFSVGAVGHKMKLREGSKSDMPGEGRLGNAPPREGSKQEGSRRTETCWVRTHVMLNLVHMPIRCIIDLKNSLPFF